MGRQRPSHQEIHREETESMMSKILQFAMLNQNVIGVIAGIFLLSFTLLGVWIIKQMIRTLFTDEETITKP